MKYLLHLLLVLGISAPIISSERATPSHEKGIPSKQRSQSASCGPDGKFSEREVQIAFEKIAAAKKSLDAAIDEEKSLKRITGFERTVDLNNLLNEETPEDLFYKKNELLSDAGKGCFFFLLIKLGIPQKTTPSKKNLIELLDLYNKRKSDRSQSVPPAIIKESSSATQTSNLAKPLAKRNRIPSCF